MHGHLWTHRPEGDREAASTQYRRDALLGRPATEDETAQVVLFLFTNTFTAGVTVYTDCGYEPR